MSTQIQITPASGITVGTTAVTSGTVGRVFFQGTGDVVQQDPALFWDNTNKRLGVGATPDTNARLDVRAQGALSTDIGFRVRNSADTIDRLSLTGTAFSITTVNRAEMSVSANAINFGLDNHNVVFSHSSAGQVLQTQRSVSAAFCHFATLGLSNVETLTNGSTIFGSTIRAGVLTNVQNKMHFVCDQTKWGLDGVYSAGFQWFKGDQSGDAAFNTATLPSITTANRQMWLTPENSLLFFNTSGITFTTNTDAFQMYSADRGGTAGKASAHFRAEDGTINVIGDFSGFGTDSPQARLDVRAQGALSTDIAFRVRNSADTRDMLNIKGDQSIRIGATEGDQGNINITPNQIQINKGASLFVRFQIASRSIIVNNGSANTGIVDAFEQYSADITAGNAAPHFRTENGSVIKLYQETTAVTAATFVANTGNNVKEDSTFDGYTMKQVVKALRNMGILA